MRTSLCRAFLCMHKHKSDIRCNTDAHSMLSWQVCGSFWMSCSDNAVVTVIQGWRWRYFRRHGLGASGLQQCPCQGRHQLPQQAEQGGAAISRWRHERVQAEVLMC